MPNHVFLISPADCSGTRARQLLGKSDHPLASRLRAGAAVEIGDAFTFISSLYFRAKLGYARAFGASHPRVPAVLVIVPGRGLLSPDTPVTAHDLSSMARVPVDPDNREYAAPLVRDATRMLGKMPAAARAVLLGSIATDRYVGPLASVLGERLYLPTAFVGRGAMSRGGLLLRAVEARRELEYVPVTRIQRHGARPPRLEPRG